MSMMPIVPTPGRGQVERRRRAEAARAEQQDLGVEQPQLALLADLGQQQVAVVAVALVGVSVRGVVQASPSSFQRLKPPAIETTSV